MPTISVHIAFAKFWDSTELDLISVSALALASYEWFLAPCLGWHNRSVGLVLAVSISPSPMTSEAAKEELAAAKEKLGNLLESIGKAIECGFFFGAYMRDCGWASLIVQACASSGQLSASHGWTKRKRKKKMASCWVLWRIVQRASLRILWILVKMKFPRREGWCRGTPERQRPAARLNPWCRICHNCS